MFSVTSKNIQTERSELKIKTTKLDKELKGLKYTNVVKYSNIINRVEFANFKAFDLNVLFTLFSCLKDTKEKGNVFYASDIMNKLKVRRTYKELEESLLKIFNTIEGSEVYNSFGEVTDKIYMFDYFNCFKTEDNKRKIDIKLTNLGRKYLTNFRDGEFTYFDLQEFLSIKSLYGKHLYRMLKQFRFTGVFTIKMTTLKKIFDIPSTYTNSRIVNELLYNALSEVSNYFKDLELIKNHTAIKNRIHSITIKFLPQNHISYCLDELNIKEYEDKFMTEEDVLLMIKEEVNKGNQESDLCVKLQSLYGMLTGKDSTKIKTLVNKANKIETSNDSVNTNIVEKETVKKGYDIIDYLENMDAYDDEEDTIELSDENDNMLSEELQPKENVDTIITDGDNISLIQYTLDSLPTENLESELPYIAVKENNKYIELTEDKAKNIILTEKDLTLINTYIGKLNNIGKARSIDKKDFREKYMESIFGKMSISLYYKTTLDSLKNIYEMKKNNSINLPDKNIFAFLIHQENSILQYFETTKSEEFVYYTKLLELELFKELLKQKELLKSDKKKNTEVVSIKNKNIPLLLRIIPNFNTVDENYELSKREAEKLVADFYIQLNSNLKPVVKDERKQDIYTNELIFAGFEDKLTEYIEKYIKLNVNKMLKLESKSGYEKDKFDYNSIINIAKVITGTIERFNCKEYIKEEEKENIKKSYSMAKKMKLKAETEMNKKFVKKDDFYY